MNYRLATVLEREVHASDITKVIDITLRDPISQLIVIHEPYNSASGIPTAHPAKCITKIELVDGSDILFSLSGQEAQSVDWYHRKQEPLNHLIYLPTMYSEQVFVLNFGRWLWDTTLALLPANFKNPQLKITIDVNGGGSTVTTGYLTVLAQIFDEKTITPAGFLMHKEVKDYALAASAHEYTPIPVDFPIRKLLAKIQKYATGVEYCFENVKLSEDNDKRVPINNTIAQILKALVGQTKAYEEWILVEGSATSKVGYCTPGYFPTFTGTMWEGTASTMTAAILEGDGGRFKVDMVDGQGNFQIHGKGWCPHCAIELPFGDPNDPLDWYDVSKVGSLQLDIKAASGMSSSESCQVFLQQLRPY
jgi:hypothetical protein